MYEEENIHEILLMISELLLKINKYDENIENDLIVNNILNEIDKLYYLYDYNIIRLILTDFKGAIISLISSINTTQEYFINIQNNLNNITYNNNNNNNNNNNELLNNIDCQILFIRLKIICILYLNNYFNDNGNINKIRDECIEVFNRFISLPDVHNAIIVEYENHPIETIWKNITEPCQTKISNKILYEIGLLQNILQSYTFHEYNITTNNGQVLQFNYRLLYGHTNHINSILIHDNVLYSASSDMTIKLWNLNEYNEITTLTGHQANIIDMCISQDGDRLYSIDYNGCMKIWDLEIITEIFNKQLSYFRSIKCIFISLNYVCCGCEDGRVILLDFDSLNEMMVFQGHKTSINSIKFNDFNNTLYTCGKILKIWSINLKENTTHILEQTLTNKLYGHNYQISCMLIWDNRLYTASHTIRVWDINTLQLIGECKKHLHLIQTLLISGERLYSASHVIKIWNINTFRLLYSLKGYIHPIKSIAVIGDEIYTVCEEQNIIQVRHINL